MDGIKKGDIMEVAIPSLKNANMNWKERRKWLKVAKLKRMEAMAHGEFKTSKVREKYDVYFTKHEAPLYKSYNNKKSIEELAEKVMKEVFTGQAPPTSNHRFYEMYYLDMPTTIIQNTQVEATEITACYVWIENDREGNPYYWNEYVPLFYYVDDSFEL